MKEEILSTRQGCDGEVLTLAFDSLDCFVIKTSSDGGRTTKSIRLTANQYDMLYQCMIEGSSKKRELCGKTI